MSDIETRSTPPEVRMPGIPVGLGTKLGVYSTAVLGIAALVTAVLEGDYTPETVTALVGAVITLATTLAGRFAQAYALLRDQPSLSNVATAVEGINAPLPPSNLPGQPMPPTAVPPR